MEPLSIIAITILVFFTSFTGASVGGGGLIVIPVMIALGVPAPAAVAAKRVSLLGASPIGLYKFHRGGKVIWRIGIPLIAVSVVAAFVAANIVLSVDESVLKRVIGMVILAVLVIIAANKKLGLEERARKRRKRHRAAGYASYFGSDLAGHVAGGGGGILNSYSLIFFHGMTFLKAAGTRKVAGIFGTITGSLVYIFSGIIIWDLAMPMLVSSALGVWIGSHYAIKRGDSFVRSLFILIAAAVAVFLFMG